MSISDYLRKLKGLGLLRYYLFYMDFFPAILFFFWGRLVLRFCVFVLFLCCICVFLLAL